MRGFHSLTDDDDAAASGRALLALSDIHGDLEALDAVLAAVRDVELCGVVATGDHCMGGADPFGVWRRLQEIGAVMTRGASDVALGVLNDATVRRLETAPGSVAQADSLLTFRRTQEALGDVICRRLAELPSTAVVSLDDMSGVMVLHGSPSDEHQSLCDGPGLVDDVGCVAEDVVVVGRSHEGFAKRVRNGLLVVNAGSVGQSNVPGPRGERTAHAVLIVPCVDRRVRAYGRDVPLLANAERARRAG